MRRTMMGLGLALALACGGEGPADGSAEGEAASGSAPSASPAPPAASEGLEIEHVVEGSGPSPKPTDVVEVHYHGTFPDGGVFDSSVDRGQPARFPLNRVIPCWTQGVTQMKVGGKAKLICPPNVAYGPRGAPPRIPPNATLHFEVELLSIQ